MRKLIRLGLAGCATILALAFILMAVVFAGPVSSGALFLLMPTSAAPAHQDRPASYEPLHKGHVDLSVGFYVRKDEDLVVDGTPRIVLRRTYLSTWRVPKQFGIGTTHDGEMYLVGDPKQFQWAALVRAAGRPEIRFERTSPGTSYVNAMFEHRGMTEYHGARLGWTGLGWTMRLPDGSGASFRSCGPKPGQCSILQTRDAHGNSIDHKRDLSGRLLRMEASADRWIAFDYDDKDRVRRAHDSAGRQVRYTYDGPGRLIRVDTFDGKTREYTYTDRDEMRTISDPGISIENTYDADGRCTKQIDRFPGQAEPLIFQFEYRGEGRAIVETTSTVSDGTWSSYKFNADHFLIAESWGETGRAPATLTYERDPVTTAVVGMTLTCPDRSGRQTPHSSGVQPGFEDWVKWDLFQTHCTWSDWIKGRQARRLDREPQ